MTIEERRCPRCAQRRTARLGSWGSICFNCRRHLDSADGAAQMVLPRWTTRYVFEPAELVRLERYRAAIQAGLYTDWPPANTMRTIAPID